VAGPQDFERAFSEVHANDEIGVLLPFDSTFFANRTQLAQVAIAHGLPLMAFNELYVKAGGFVSYGPDAVDLFRRTGAYVEKILKGTKPADLPIEQPTKYNLAINLKTARAIGLTVPASVLARADMVAE
jgi:putative tryptophan/tyrosine transport system substrate-binding protein